MSRFLETLKTRVLVCDGAMGTQLMSAGLEAGKSTEEWNLTNRDKVLEVQRQYAKAGARILLTNTFGANRWSMQRHGLENRCQEIISEAIAIAREAGGPDVFVAGDIGPTGELPEPYGTRTEAEFLEVLGEQARLLAGAGVDLILVETQMSSDEMKFAVRAAKEAAGLPVCASASFSPNHDNTDYRTMMGENVEQMVEAALESGADIVGTNCGAVDILDMVKIVTTMRSLTSGPILVEPNAGKPVIEDGGTVYTQTPEDMAKHVREVVEAGANIIGGCCGTTPAHIAAIASVISTI